MSAVEAESPPGQQSGPEENPEATQQAVSTEVNDTALKAARLLAEHGVPLFLAQPDMTGGRWNPHGGHHETGYFMPARWQLNKPDPAVVDRWRPGMALCAVMGHGVDLLDIDPHKGGDAAALNGTMPTSYGRTATPSGGTHDLIAGLGRRSRDGVLPGIDVKAGTADGEGRGFAFLPPTVKASKVDGTVRPYRWLVPPHDLTKINRDTTGAALGTLLQRPEAARVPAYTGPAYDALSGGQRAMADAEVDQRVSLWADRLTDAADWPEGRTDDKGRGWELLTRDCAWSLAAMTATGWTGVDEDRAQQLYAEIVPGVIRDDPKCRSQITDADFNRVTDASVHPPPWDGLDVINDEPDATDDRHELAVRAELERLRVREDARRRFAEADATTVELPALQRLDAFLAVPDELITHRVEGLWPAGGRVVLAAAQKSGKTTLTGNLVRSLVDGGPFLGQFAVEAVDRVVLIDDELDQRMIRRWLRDQSINRTTSVDVLSLRGRLSSFDVLNPAVRQRWAELIGPADVLVLDCLRPALDALALSEDKEAGRFLEALDELTAGAGIAETLVVHHMGHSSERSRGDSRILDWPDAVWKLVREDADDPMSARYFSAYGRDVDQPEARLAFDPSARRLSVDGGSRRDARRVELEQRVLEFVSTTPGCTQREVEKQRFGRRADVRQALRSLAASGGLRVEINGQSRNHYLSEAGDEA